LTEEDNQNRTKIAIYNSENVWVEQDLNVVASMILKKDKRKQVEGLHKFITSELGEMVMVFQNVLQQAAKELGYEELRMLSYLMAVCDFENWIRVSQKSIAESLGIQQSSVSRAINNLAKKEYLEINKQDRLNFYRIKHKTAWKGKLELLKNQIIEFKSKQEEGF